MSQQVTNKVAVKIDKDGEAFVVINDKDNETNQLTFDLLKAIKSAMQEAIKAESVRAIILSSTKRDFCFGLDYAEILNDTKAIAIAKMVSDLFGLIEQSPKPVIALVNGSAAGIGLGLVVACHYRVACLRADARYRFNEIQYGVTPMGGVTWIVPRIVGLPKAYQYLVEGKSLTLTQAQSDRLFHQSAGRNQAINTIKAWITHSAQDALWKRRYKHETSQNTLQFLRNQNFWMLANADLQKKKWAFNDMQRTLMSLIYKGMFVSSAEHRQYEARIFEENINKFSVKAQIHTQYITLRQANRLMMRPMSVPKSRVSTLGIVGAGMMGAGIALCAAIRGINVAIVEASVEKCEAASLKLHKEFSAYVTNHQFREKAAQTLMNRISVSHLFSTLNECDMVIEAVYEDMQQKKQVLNEVQKHVSNQTVIASNTSKLSITELARSIKMPQYFIGLHFFSPVMNMPLVEVIKGKKTSDVCLAKSLDFVRQISKTPIVIKDKHGFFTTRIFESYLVEGISMLEEGFPGHVIERAAKLAGMPLPPLLLADSVSLPLMLNVLSTNNDLGQDTEASIRAQKVVNLMVKDLKRNGRMAQQGFYEYPDTGAKCLWKDLSVHFPVKLVSFDIELLASRFMHIQSIEALKALNEGVVRSSEDANLASVLGLGFPKETGGVVSYAGSVGLEHFIHRSEQLTAIFGSRFKLSEPLIQRLETITNWR